MLNLLHRAAQQTLPCTLLVQCPVCFGPMAHSVLPLPRQQPVPIFEKTALVRSPHAPLPLRCHTAAVAILGVGLGLVLALAVQGRSSDLTAHFQAHATGLPRVQGRAAQGLVRSDQRALPQSSVGVESQKVCRFQGRVAGCGLTTH